MGRYDFHIHSLLSEGVLVPSEIARRCSVLGYKAIAISDHVDPSNVESILKPLVPACKELQEHYDMRIIPGVEITHVPPPLIPRMVDKARRLGAEIVIVHGETIAEPVIEGTNITALEVSGVDILAHPGLISEEEARAAKENNVFLEITSRKGHSLANGHVAAMAKRTGAKILLNSDAHEPSDLISDSDAEKIALGCGLSKIDARRVLEDYPVELLEQIRG